MTRIFAAFVAILAVLAQVNHARGGLVYNIDVPFSADFDHAVGDIAYDYAPVANPLYGFNFNNQTTIITSVVTATFSNLTYYNESESDIPELQFGANIYGTLRGNKNLILSIMDYAPSNLVDTWQLPAGQSITIPDQTYALAGIVGGFNLNLVLRPAETLNLTSRVAVFSSDFVTSSGELTTTPVSGHIEGVMTYTVAFIPEPTAGQLAGMGALALILGRSLVRMAPKSGEPSRTR